MANNTTDLSNSQFEISTRSARFQRSGHGQRGVDAPTANGDSRRADFRPPESVARRREVVEEFRNELLDEALDRSDETGESADALQAAVLAEEALGEFEKAERRIHGLARQRTPTAADRRLYRRILRAARRSDPIVSSLERSVRSVE